MWWVEGRSETQNLRQDLQSRGGMVCHRVDYPLCNFFLNRSSQPRPPAFFSLRRYSLLLIFFSLLALACSGADWPAALSGLSIAATVANDARIAMQDSPLGKRSPENKPSGLAASTFFTSFPSPTSNALRRRSTHLVVQQQRAHLGQLSPYCPKPTINQTAQNPQKQYDTARTSW